MLKIISFSDLNRYVDYTIIYLYLCQKPPVHNLKKENIAPFSPFLKFLKYCFLHHIMLKNTFKDLEFSK